jgi:PAS domain S-box-containing protein
VRPEAAPAEMAGSRAQAKGGSPRPGATRRTPAILRCDAELRVLDMNPTAGQVLSRRREEVVGHSLLRHLDDADASEVARIRSRLVTRGVKVDTVDVRCTGRSGDARVVTLTFTWLPRLDADGAEATEGHPGEFVVLLSPSDADPSAAVRNPASIPDRAPDLIWRYRLWPERGFEYVSPSTTTLLGYPPSAFYLDADLMHLLAATPEDREQLFHLYENRFDPHELTTLRLRHRDGRIRSFEQRTSPILDGERRILAIEAIGRDVTEREEAAAELSAIVRLRQLLDAHLGTDDLESVQPADVLQAALAAVCEHTGWSVGHAVLIDADPRALPELAEWHVADERLRPLQIATDQGRWHQEPSLTDDAALLGEPMWTVLPDRHDTERSKLAAAYGLRIAIAVPVPVEGSVAAALEFLTENATPPPQSLLSALKDTAVEVGHALRRSHLLSSLRRTDKARTDFVSRAAHELRGPVGSISLMASALALEAERSDAPTLSARLSRLAAQADRLQLMASRLLELSQLEDDRFEVDLQDLPLIQVIEDATAAVGPGAEGQPPIEIVVDPSIWVHADSLLLSQIFSNLLANARRYGGPHICITAAADGDRIQIVVADDGPGVPPNLVPHLFAPMRSSLATIEHAGLGLALVRQMTITLGGDIAYEPNDDAGARFVLHLARARRSNEAEISAPPAHRGQNPT